MADKSITEEALKNYRIACDAYTKQLDREIEDLKFQVPELQWDELSRRQRSSEASSGVPTPARPMLSIPKLDQPIQLILNQERAAHLGVNIHPLSEDANDETAEVLQGLYRKIERDSRANIARSWAFDRAVKAGRGVYRIGTCYDEESGNTFDQRITIERILYQQAVKFDPAAKEPDFSDGEWAFVTEWVPIETFNRLYPGVIPSDVDPFDAAGMRDKTPDWIKYDGEERAVLVGEYFKKVHEKKRVFLLEDGSIVDNDPPEGAKIVTMRTVDDVKVMWYKLAPGGDGLQVLEEQEWNGKYIPLVPVIGRELQAFDSERRWVGVIAPAKDAQRLYNYAASTAVEIAALEPKAPFVGAEGQFEGHEEWWMRANTRNLPYLEYKPMDLNGHLLPPPQRMQVDTSRLGPSMALLQQADDFIQAATSTPDPALGNLTSRDRSGKAIQALQQQSDASTSNYMHNLAQISMTYEAKVILDMIPRVYDRPGRIARILDMEDESRTVVLNAPFFESDGMPVRADVPQLPMGAGANVVPFRPRAQPKRYDLTKGRYGVSVSIGKSYQTRLEQGADEIGQILQAQPQLMPLIGPIYFKFRDFPGAKELSEILKKVRDQQNPALGQKEGEEDPAALQAKLQQAGQQNQMLQQQLQQAVQYIKTEQAKQQAAIQQTQQDNAAKIEAERIKAEVQVAIERMREEAETQRLLLEQRFDAIQKALDRQQTHAMAESAAQERREHQTGQEARGE